MKIKLAFLFACVSLCACLAVAIICHLHSLMLVSFVFYIVSIIGFISLIGLVCYRDFMRNRIIDPKSHLKRNYDKILLGEMAHLEYECDNTLDLRGVHRNAYTDSLLVERYYSFLKENGCIEIFPSRTKYYHTSNKVNPLDYPLLHAVTLMENGIPKWKFKYVLLNPTVGLMYLLQKMCSIAKRIARSPSNALSFEKLVRFCKQRSIRIHIHSADC